MMIEADELRARITINPTRCGGYPCIRDLPVRVSIIMDLLADGLTPTEILEQMPNLEAGDILAAIYYATGDYVEMRKLLLPKLTIEELFAEVRRLEARQRTPSDGLAASREGTIDTPAPSE